MGRRRQKDYPNQSPGYLLCSPGKQHDFSYGGHRRRMANGAWNMRMICCHCLLEVSTVTKPFKPHRYTEMELKRIRAAA